MDVVRMYGEREKKRGACGRMHARVARGLACGVPSEKHVCTA